MIVQTQGKIYLAAQRGISQRSGFRSFHTFNSGNDQEESRGSFGNLQMLNDDTLAGGESYSMTAVQNTDVILLPVVGAVEYRNSLGGSGILEAGQFQIFSAAQGMDFDISNPYETELVNLLQIWLKNDDPGFISKNQEGNIDLKKRNQLVPLFSQNKEGLKIQQPAYGYLGKYEGRKEEIYVLENPENGIFVFVIEGAFEVQNRLLEARDGLSLRHLKTLEFEALSNDAILLIIELSISTAAL